MTPEITLAELQKGQPQETRELTLTERVLDVATHGREEVQRRLWRYIDAGIPEFIMRNPAVTSEMLTHMMYLPESEYNMLLSTHPKISAESITKYAESQGVEEAARYLRHPNCPIELLEVFRDTPKLRFDFQRIAIRNKNLPEEMYFELTQNMTQAHHYALGRNTSIPQAILEELVSTEPHTAVRNHSLSTKMLTQAVHNLDGQWSTPAVDHPQLTQKIFLHICDNIIATNNMYIDFIKIISHPFMNEEMRVKIGKASPEQEPGFPGLPADTITSYAKFRESSAEVLRVAENPSASVSDLRIIYDRMIFGDLSQESRDSQEFLELVLSVILCHPNISSDFLSEIITSHIASNNGCVLHVSKAATTPQHFLNTIVHIQKLNDYRELISNPKLPVATLPILQHMIQNRLSTEVKEGAAAQVNQITTQIALAYEFLS